MSHADHKGTPGEALGAGWLWALLLPLALLLGWQAASALKLYPEQLVVPPAKVLESFIALAKDGTLWGHLKASLSRVFAGYLMGSAAGLALGVALGRSQIVEEYLGPSLTSLRQIPLYGWVPFLIVLLGVGDGFKAVFVAIGTFYPVVLNTQEGVKRVPEKYLEVGQAFGHGRFSVLAKIVLPSALPSVFTGLRTGLAMAWMSAVGAEVLASASGLGFLISWGRQLLQFDLVMVGVICIGLVGLAMNNLLNPLEAYFLRWRDNGNGKSNSL